MSIHHLDAFRYLFGDPEGIFVSARTDPRTKFPHRDGICLYILEYENGFRASAWDDVWTRAGARGVRGRHLHQVARRGHRGPRVGHHRLALLPDADAQHGALHVVSKHPGLLLDPRWSEVWFPDAFQGTMGALFDALNGGENLLTGDDNLRTMALIEAGYRSLDEKRVVRIDEIHA